MARNTTIAEQNELNLFDSLSESSIRFYYRTPTTEERQGFSNLSVQRKGRKIKMNQAAARLKYGLRIITGFREGDFVRTVNGKDEVYSSDPKSSKYLPTWKDELKNGASDLIMMLGGFVFEGSVEVADDEQHDDVEIDTQGEDASGNSEETSA